MQPILTAIAVAVGVGISLWVILVLARVISPSVVRRTFGVVLISAAVGLIYLRIFILALLMLFIGAGLILRRDTGTVKASSGQTSRVRTGHLEMTLDHDTGDTDGRILTGKYEGRMLSELHLAELFQFAANIRGDAESVRLLETYLDSAHSGWRDHAEENTTRNHGASPYSERISRDEAYRVLGLEPDASDEDIRKAHHRLIKRVHPDRGGSAVLTAQINEARDRLLGRH